MNSFKPDLIVEVTKVCNRACNGCNAPNVVSKESSQDLMRKDPSLFLNVPDLQYALLSLNAVVPRLVSIRGGEPSLHPNLAGLLNVLRFFSQEIVVETHGRWALNESLSQHTDLLAVIQFNKVKIKVSFDSMHGLGSEDLLEITSNLEAKGIEYLIAITEDGPDKFLITRNRIPWVKDEKIIYQPKASHSVGLYQPPMGVINSKGQISGGLTAKFNLSANTSALETAVG